VDLRIHACKENAQEYNAAVVNFVDKDMPLDAEEAKLRCKIILNTATVAVGIATAADPLHVVGNVRIDNDTNATNKGCLRFNGTSNKLEFSHDCTTYAELGSGSGGGGGSLTCPSGFTKLESQGNVLGCMKNTHQGTGTCHQAIDTCWTTYGGRLPTYVEARIAFGPEALWTVSVGEWTGEASWNSNNSCGMLSSGIILLPSEY
jgi:hypothetical protein